MKQSVIAFGEQFGVPPAARVVDAKVADINIRLEFQGLLVFPGAAVPASCLARVVACRFPGLPKPLTSKSGPMSVASTCGYRVSPGLRPVPKVILSPTQATLAGAACAAMPSESVAVREARIR